MTWQNPDGGPGDDLPVWLDWLTLVLAVIAVAGLVGLACFAVLMFAAGYW